MSILNRQVRELDPQLSTKPSLLYLHFCLGFDYLVRTSSLLSTLPASKLPTVAISTIAFRCGLLRRHNR